MIPREVLEELKRACEHKSDEELGKLVRNYLPNLIEELEQLRSEMEKIHEKVRYLKQLRQKYFKQTH